MILLVVEDNPDDEAMTIRALRKAGVGAQIVVAHDGAEALSLLGLNGGAHDSTLRPTVVLLDLKLPRVDGGEVLQRLRADERTAKVPVVVMSSSDDPGDITRCYEAGANSYVCKPVSSTDYTTQIGRIGVYWAQVNRTPREESP